MGHQQALERTAAPQEPVSARRGAAFSSKVFGYWVVGLDALVVILAGAASAHDLLAYTGHPELLSVYLVAVAAGTAILLFVFKLMHLYEFGQFSQSPAPLRRLVPAVGVSLISLTAVAFALRLDFLDFALARTWLVAWFALTAVGIIVARVALRTAIAGLSRSGRLRRNIAIVGSGEQAARMMQALSSGREPWNNMVGVFDDRRVPRGDELVPRTPPGSIDDLVDLVRNNMVDDIVVALPWAANTRLIELVTRLDDLPVEIYIGSDLASFVFPRSTLGWLSGVAVLDVVKNPLAGWRAVAKAIEDKILASCMILVLSPIMATVALAIRLDSPGPILFRQPRFGLNNHIFHVYKFRSMYHNRPPEAGTPQAKRGDPRITRVGAIIRRTSLDELPQLFNVLEGTMSLVGPRPHAVDHNKYYGGVIESYFARHRMKPGITGWAQVNGLRGETDRPEKMKARVQYDLEYIENWSLWLDVKIIAKTVAIVLFKGQDTAY